MKTELMTKETQPVSSSNFDRFIEMALTKQVPVETLERLLAMQKEIMAANAKAAYDEALAAFQSECPIIHKDKKVDFTSKRTGGRTSYSYAPLDSIVAQVKDSLKRNGFSYSMQAEVTTDSWVLATCKLTHIQGHSETSSFKVPIDKEAFMNSQQQVAAALTYAKRYAFCGVTGILTGDQDDDAHGADNTKDVATSQQSTPPAGKPTDKPAPQPPAQTPDGKLIATGNVVNVEDLPMPKKPGSFRYKITIEGHERPFYSFDKKVRELIGEKATSGPATIHYEVSKFGQDIKNIFFNLDTAPLEQYAGELEPKP